MEGALKLFGIIASGVQSNWWGSAVQATASRVDFHLYLLPSALDSSLDFSLLRSSAFGFVACFPPVLSGTSLSRVLTAPLIDCEAICMSQQSRPSNDDDEDLSLALEFQGLQISVRGPLWRALEFVERLSERSSGRASSVTGTESSARPQAAGTPSASRFATPSTRLS